MKGNPGRDVVIRRAAVELRAAGAIAIVGAGVSAAAGIPLTNQLPPLLWHAFDADPPARLQLASRLGVPDAPGKMLIGDDAVALGLGYETLGAYPAALKAFQAAFAARDREQASRHSPVHEVLAEFLHRRVIEIVVSLNWDTLLEAAYRRRYARTLSQPSEWLFKPHGDASDPSATWVYPTERATLPPRLRHLIADLAAVRPRVLLVVGYSEQDETVVQELITPLSERWRVFRIGPSATGPDAIGLTADEALPRLREAMALQDETPGWEYVTFPSDAGWGPALLGNALGPSSVRVCAPLPEVDAVAAELEAAAIATVIGEPGSGKSIAAYQAAWRQVQRGWEVLRLQHDRQGDANALVNALERLPSPTLALIDDAQRADPAVIRQLADRVSKERALLIVTNEGGPVSRRGVRVANDRAVRVIADAVVQHRIEVLDALRVLDDRVGDDAMHESLENRVAYARQKGRSAWEFMFILSGGERRARQHVAQLRGQDRADLLAAAVAATQLATLDAGCDGQQLEIATQLLGRSSEWTATTLATLRSQRIASAVGLVRFPHQRYASRILELVCETRGDPEWKHVVNMLRGVVCDDQYTRRGVAALLRALWFAHGTGHGWPPQPASLVDEPTWTRLTRRCLGSRDSRDRDGAGALIEALHGYHPDWKEWCAANAELFGQWITEADASAAWGLGTMVNAMINEDHALAEVVCGCSDAGVIAAKFCSAPLSEAYAWSYFLGRISFAPSTWRKTMTVALGSSSELLNKATVADVQQVSSLTALIEGVATYSVPTALKMIEKAQRVLVDRINGNFEEAYHDLDDMSTSALGMYPEFLSRRKPNPEQRRVARELFSAVDQRAAARSISSAHRRTFPNVARLLWLINRAAPRVAKRIAREVDLTTLDEPSAGLWRDPPHELEELVGSLSITPNFEPARTWIGMHQQELFHIPARFAVFAPNVSVAAMSRGASVDLGLRGLAEWDIAAYALRALDAVDASAARQVLNSHEADLTKAFELPKSDEGEGLGSFLGIAMKVSSETVGRALSQIRIGAAEERWTELLRGNTTGRKGVAALVDLAKSQSGPVVELARRIRRRFPGATRLPNNWLLKTTHEPF